MSVSGAGSVLALVNTAGGPILGASSTADNGSTYYAVLSVDGTPCGGAAPTPCGRVTLPALGGQSAATAFSSSTLELDTNAGDGEQFSSTFHFGITATPVQAG